MQVLEGPKHHQSVRVQSTLCSWSSFCLACGYNRKAIMCTPVDTDRSTFPPQVRMRMRNNVAADMYHATIATQVAFNRSRLDSQTLLRWRLHSAGSKSPVNMRTLLFTLHGIFKQGCVDYHLIIGSAGQQHRQQRGVLASDQSDMIPVQASQVS